MMPEEWPIAASSADGIAPARLAGRGRLATVRRDFFLDPAKRLTEQERALMTAMFHCLVSDIADSIRAALPNGKIAANDEGDAVLIEELTISGLLDQPDLMALVLRRADEERIATAARARSGRREARVLQGLVSHDHGAIASAAMALILGRGRRRDRFGQCLIMFDDLTPATAEVLVRGIDSLTAALVHFLDEAGGLTDELVLAAANEGEVSFVGEVVARRAAVPTDAAMDELLSGEATHVMGLLRVAGVSRELGAGLLAGIGDLLGIEDAGAAISLFDQMSSAEVQSVRSWLTAAPGYRAALERLGQGRG